MRYIIGSLLSTAVVANAHIALWHESMFGLNYPGQAGDAKQNYNGNEQVAPLRGTDQLTIDQWFAHGYKAYPPLEGKFAELPAGGTFTAELGCNRAYTSLRDPRQTKALPEYACTTNGPLHNANALGPNPDPSLFGGTAIAIAYTSDANALQPGDMTVISVNHVSAWTRETRYDIPSGLGECPEGGCLCTWNWLHQAAHGEGYGSEFYNILFRCKITNASGGQTIPVGKAAVPALCEGDYSKCVKGPKQPLYAYQKDGNNLPSPKVPPTYNLRYGFADGAQSDILSGSSGSTGTTNNASASTSSAVGHSTADSTVGASATAGSVSASATQSGTAKQSASTTSASASGASSPSSGRSRTKASGRVDHLTSDVQQRQEGKRVKDTRRSRSSISTVD